LVFTGNSQSKSNLEAAISDRETAMTPCRRGSSRVAFARPDSHPSGPTAKPLRD
jgi:hypothetical protein